MRKFESFTIRVNRCQPTDLKGNPRIGLEGHHGIVCLNDPVNMIDPLGLCGSSVDGPGSDPNGPPDPTPPDPEPTPPDDDPPPMYEDWELRYLESIGRRIGEGSIGAAELIDPAHNLVKWLEKRQRKKRQQQAP